MTTVPGRLGKLIDECGTLVQVALDLRDPYKALRIGRSALVAKSIILEAGTPLVKSYGISSVTLLRALDPPAVVADMKTFDTGALEVDIAADAGADATTVLALAPEETVREAARRAEERGVALIVDTIGHPDPVEAARQARRLGGHIVLLHVGVDVQKRLGLTAASMAGLIGKVREAFQGPVAVAGGIRPGQAGDMARAGASIVVIGGGITRARDPREAAITAVRETRPTCT